MESHECHAPGSAADVFTVLRCRQTAQGGRWRLPCRRWKDKSLPSMVGDQPLGFHLQTATSLAHVVSPNQRFVVLVAALWVVTAIVLPISEQ